MIAQLRISKQYVSNTGLTFDQERVNLSLDVSPQQDRESQPPKDVLLLRNPAYERNNQQYAKQQEKILQKNILEPTYDVIPPTQGQVSGAIEEEGSQYNILDRSRQVNVTPTRADVIQAEVDSNYSTLQ